jgi:hypothetical protein
MELNDPSVRFSLKVGKVGFAESLRKQKWLASTSPASLKFFHLSGGITNGQ